MAFIDCNEQVTATKAAWPNQPHCDHGPWQGSGTCWKSPKARRKYVNRQYRRRRKERIEFLGGRCVNCGTTSDLEFDHIDPQTKEFTLSDGGYQGLSISNPKILAELAKCQLLCKLCHQAKTAQEAGQSATAKQDQLEALINQYGRTA